MPANIITGIVFIIAGIAAFFLPFAWIVNLIVGCGLILIGLLFIGGDPSDLFYFFD